MRIKTLFKKQILAFTLSAAMLFGSMPVGVLAEETERAAALAEAKTMPVFTYGSQAEQADDGEGGQAVQINASWVSGSGGRAASAAFEDSSVFQKSEFTLFMDVKRIAAASSNNDNNGKNVAFSVGKADNYLNLCVAQHGYLRYKSNNGDEQFRQFDQNPSKADTWTSVVLSYKETDGNGNVTVYIDTKKVLDQVNVGFALSSMENFTANIGGGYGTGFMGKGLYRNIRITDTAVAEGDIVYENPYQPYSSFSGAANGTLGTGNVAVRDWLDTNGAHIQAHGGQAQWLDTLDLNEDGVAEGGYIWYGEDKTRNGRPIDGIHCYTSPDLYNWTDRGMALYTHDLVPEKLDSTGEGIELDTDGLANLKNWAEMAAPSESVSQDDIDMAKNFVKAYQKEDGTYDEANLAKAYKYLYSGYCIAERPKMLYNETTQKYVLIYHADGPSDENIVKFLKENASPSRYTRAGMGFAVSDTPYGPFKLINVQRMNYVEGNYDSSKGMARDMNVFVDDTDINKDGVKDAYAIYSSEENAHMYVSLLNADYTGPAAGGNGGTVTFGNGSTTMPGPAAEGNQKMITLEDGTKIQAFEARVLGSNTSREAPAVFKYHGYYYMITSGTSGWKANAARYFRAKNIYGPWEALGDPCKGTSSTTFVSQPTAVIPVDAAKGKFIYMGDRWNYSLTDDKGNTDSAHWDSGYVWLPITINRDYTITIENEADWNLSWFENIDVWDYIEIDSDIPSVITSAEDLPEQIDITINGEKFENAAVEWNWDIEKYFETCNITGVLAEHDNSEVLINVTVVPENLVYFADAGTEGKTDRALYNQLVETCGTLKNKSASDQAYSTESGWGYAGSNTAQRNSDGTIYETLRYINSSTDRTLVYQFDRLEEGCYTLYLGVYDPAGWYKGNRQAAVTVKQNDTILKTDETDCGGNGKGFFNTYETLIVEGDGGLQVTLAPKNTGEGSDMQLSWIAIAKNQSYTVTFVSEGTELKKQVVPEGGAATAPETPVRDGYIFDGWDTEFNQITEDLTVRAKWIKGHIVQFMDGEIVLKKETVATGEAATTPAIPVKDGYIFKGWDKDFTNVTSDLEIKAVWEERKEDVIYYTVTFKDGDTVLKTGQVESGTSAAAPETPVKDGYIFKGWDKDFTNVTSDLEIKAVWEERKEDAVYYTVTFKNGDMVLKTEQVESGTSATAPEIPVKAGYIFKGWDKAFTSVTSDLTVTAVWEKQKEETVYYTVTFKDGDTVLKTEQVESGKAATAPANPVKAGYVFKGWDKAFASVTSNLTVNAVWTKDASGGSGNGDGGTEAPETIAAKKVTINTKKLYLVKGKIATLKALITPADSTDKLTWSSSKSSVASVSKGKIKAKKTGTATITVKAGRKKATCKVYVVKKAVKAKSVKLNKKKANLNKGSWILLTSTLKPSKSTDTVKWKSSDSKIAFVSNGFVTAKKKGKVTITATANGKKAKCTITVK